MQIYARLLDAAQTESKEKINGQMSLFDFMAPEEKASFEIKLPPVGEFDPEEKLGFEKEVLGVYLSGHPLENDIDLLKARTTASSQDFAIDEETDEPKVENGARAVIGGMITEKTIKYTKTNQVMAFVTVEDLVGSVEVLAFPRVYDRYRALLEEDSRVLLEGRVSVEDDKPGKLILDRVTSFSEVPRELWLAFPDKASYEEVRMEISELCRAERGRDSVFVFIRNPKGFRKEYEGIALGEELLYRLREMLGEAAVAVRVAREKY